MKRVDKDMVMQAVKDSMRRHIGTPPTKETEKAIKGTAEKILQDFTKTGVLNSFKVKKVSTVHKTKSLWGRTKDFFCWRTPFRRWYFKPAYVQVDLGDELTLLWEYTGAFEGLNQEEFDDILESVKGVKVWRQLWPEDPYTTIISDISVSPVMPVDHVSFTFEVGDKP